MKIIKTIEELYNRANKQYLKSGEGFARINGRMSYGWGHTGELEEKYSVSIINVDGEKRVTLSHWGTRTATISESQKRALHVYGESNSDRDSINTLLYILGINEGRCRYFPSTGDFVYEGKDFKHII